MARRRVESELITHRDIAKRIGIKTALLRSWVARQAWPAPHSIIEGTMFFRRADFEHFMKERTWP